ncbi:hypothetical protein ACFE04_031060 [Oxalis oulophora]
MQFYQHPFDMEGGFPTSDHSSNFASSRSSTTSDELSSPKSCLSKPVIRRRSRISKKTPITLLNANRNNFRALVQEFTGCPTPSSLLKAKGPINLCFEIGKKHRDHDHDHDEYYSAPLMSSFRKKYSRQEAVKVQTHEQTHYQHKLALNDNNIGEVNGTIDHIDVLMNEIVMDDIFLDDLLQ